MFWKTKCHFYRINRIERVVEYVFRYIFIFNWGPSYGQTSNLHCPNYLCINFHTNGTFTELGFGSNSFCIDGHDIFFAEFPIERSPWPMLWNTLPGDCRLTRHIRTSSSSCWRIRRTWLRRVRTVQWSGSNRGESIQVMLSSKISRLALSTTYPPRSTTFLKKRCRSTRRKSFIEKDVHA